MFSCYTEVLCRIVWFAQWVTAYFLKLTLFSFTKSSNSSPKVPWTSKSILQITLYIIFCKQLDWIPYFSFLPFALTTRKQLQRILTFSEKAQRLYFPSWWRAHRPVRTEELRTNASCFKKLFRDPEQGESSDLVCCTECCLHSSGAILEFLLWTFLSRYSTKLILLPCIPTQSI